MTVRQRRQNGGVIGAEGGQTAPGRDKLDVRAVVLQPGGHKINHAAGNPVRIEFSRGTVRFPEDGGSIDVLIYGADLKMYNQKREMYAKRKDRRVSDLLTSGPEA